MIHSFRTRLIVLLLLLSTATLTAAAIAVGVALEQQITRSVQQELTVSNRVFEELLNRRSALLRQAAKVLAGDFGFRRAIATGDKETIISALINHGERIGTELMILNTPQGGEIAATHSLPSTVLEGARQRMGHSLVMAEGELYQLVTVPVLAPELIAHATLGFHIDSSLARRLKDLANADISVWIDSSDSMLASSLPEDMQQSLMANQAQQASLAQWLSHHELAGQRAELSTLQDRSIHVLVSSSMQVAMQEYHRLQWLVLVIAVIALTVSAAIAIVTARSVARPLYQLINAANQLQRGDYSALAIEQRSDEFGQLANTFESMRAAIAKREERIYFQATHDQLTELPNRRYFANAIEHRIQQGQNGFLLVVNIYQFRTLNDTLGQAVGDSVLQQVAQRLKAFAGESLIGRVGGDEFAVFITDVEIAEGSDRLQQLQQRLEEQVQVGESDFPIAFNCAVVAVPEHGRQFGTLLRRAQVTVKKAKNEQSFVRFYNRGLDEEYLRKLSIIEQLDDAVSNHELQVLIQPKIASDSGLTIGGELLLRWHSPSLGFVGPDEFIPLAEQSGRITKLTRWVAYQATHILQSLAPSPGMFTLSLNLSAIDILSDEILTLIDELEQEVPELNQLLVLEITESAIVSDPDKAIERLNQLRQRGYGISIDDYGTGYSSLEQMSRLPVTELKIDRAFIQHLSSNPKDQSIVRSTINLAHELNLYVVAEGVEDEESWRWLQQQNCEVLQGFYFSKPISYEQFVERLQGEQNDV